MLPLPIPSGERGSGCGPWPVTGYMVGWRRVASRTSTMVVPSAIVTLIAR